MEASGYWDDVERSQAGMKELNGLKEEKSTFEELKSQYEDIETLLEMGYEEEDATLIPEIEEELNAFIGKLESMRIKTLLSGECNSKTKRRSRRDRKLRLGWYAVSDVQPLGRAQRVLFGGLRLP